MYPIPNPGQTKKEETRLLMRSNSDRVQHCRCDPTVTGTSVAKHSRVNHIGGGTLMGVLRFGYRVAIPNTLTVCICTAAIRCSHAYDDCRPTSCQSVKYAPSFERTPRLPLSMVASMLPGYWCKNTTYRRASGGKSIGEVLLTTRPTGQR